MTTQCSIPGCKKPVQYVERGICNMHYHRFRRNGTYDLLPKAARQYRVEMPGKGYQRLYEPLHPLADTQGYVSEHRMVVYARYGDMLPGCEICGKAITWKDCHIDHIDKNVRNNDPANVRPLCRPCNTFRDYPARHTFEKNHAITFDGITQTANEWAKDPRVNVANGTILRRKRLGASDYEALFGPKITHNGKGRVKKPTPPKSTRKNSINAVIDGVTKTSMEWSREPGCTVSEGTIRNRIKAGWPHRDAVFAPPKSAIHRTY